MSEAERGELIAGIIQDSPQMTNAVNNLDPDSLLRVRVCFNLLPNVYACVSRISLVSRNQSKGSTPDSENIILDVSQEAALKLHEKYRQYQHDEARVRALREFSQSLDRDEWMRPKTFHLFVGRLLLVEELQQTMLLCK